MIDLLLILIIAGVTWAVAGEGPWGAAMVLFSVIVSGLLAMNLFEPVAGYAKVYRRLDAATVHKHIDGSHVLGEGMRKEMLRTQPFGVR